MPGPFSIHEVRLISDDLQNFNSLREGFTVQHMSLDQNTFVHFYQYQYQYLFYVANNNNNNINIFNQGNPSATAVIKGCPEQLKIPMFLAISYFTDMPYVSKLRVNHKIVIVMA